MKRFDLKSLVPTVTPPGGIPTVAPPQPVSYRLDAISTAQQIQLIEHCLAYLKYAADIGRFVKVISGGDTSYTCLSPMGVPIELTTRLTFKAKDEYQLRVGPVRERDGDFKCKLDKGYADRARIIRNEFGKWENRNRALEALPNVPRDYLPKPPATGPPVPPGAYKRANPSSPASPGAQPATPAPATAASPGKAAPVSADASTPPPSRNLARIQALKPRTRPADGTPATSVTPAAAQATPPASPEDAEFNALLAEAGVKPQVE